MVTLVVTIEEEWLRRVDASLQTVWGTEGDANVEEGLDCILNIEPGELSHVVEYQTLIQWTKSFQKRLIRNHPLRNQPW